MKKIIIIICFLLILGIIVNDSNKNDEENECEDAFTYTDTISYYYRSIGELEGNIFIKNNSVLSSNNEILLSDNKLLYPTLSIEAICLKDVTINEHGIKANKEDITKIFKYINESKCEGIINEYDDMDLSDYYGLQADIVVKLNNNEYLTWQLLVMENDYVYIYINNDDTKNFSSIYFTQDYNNDNQYYFLRIKSKHLANQVKKLIEWQTASIEDVYNIKRITVLDYDQKISSINSDDTKKFIKLVTSNCKETKDQYYVDYYTLSCELNDGRTIKIGINEEGYLSFEGSYYQMNSTQEMYSILGVEQY